MRLFISLILLLLMSFNLQADSNLFTQRGLVKEISSKPDVFFPNTYRTVVSLKSMGPRASCPEIKLSAFDKSGIEILKLSVQLNRPVEIEFHIAQGNSEEVAKMPIHCQAESISFKL